MSQPAPFAQLLTRSFTVLVDPQCIPVESQHSRLADAFDLVEDLANIDPPITIRLVFPTYLATSPQLLSVQDDDLPFDLFTESERVPELTLSRNMSGRRRGRIERGAEDECRGHRLLSLAQYVKVDGILCNIPSVVDARYDLLVQHTLRVVLPTEFGDFVEICGRGNGAACSVAKGFELPADLLYQLTHWKGARLFEWFNKISSTVTDSRLRECLRSALLNRYSFIIAARDHVRFYEVQSHHHFRHTGRRGEFRGALNYHLTSFYLHVWGMLDSLAQIANLKLRLDVPSRRCGISTDAFLDALNRQRPALYRFIRHYGPQWIAVMGDVRHPAAHSAMLLQRDFLATTPDSEKSDEEIIAILKEEDPVLHVKYEAFSKPLLGHAIFQWRVRHMRLVTDDAIYVEDTTGASYIRPGATSIDADVEMLNVFIDAFLFTCFGAA